MLKPISAQVSVHPRGPGEVKVAPTTCVPSMVLKAPAHSLVVVEVLVVAVVEVLSPCSRYHAVWLNSVLDDVDVVAEVDVVSVVVVEVVAVDVVLVVV
mmetsp:Transcript_31873/g.69575  ORF Transcript_31873/g.69575 Transcript_31873/m.69575 type:complete len:98 (+) Transcript_31873:3080-3373(+)